MANPIGAIVVEFVANIARFFTDCDKVNNKAKKTANDIHLSFTKIAEITLGVSFAKGLEGIVVAARDAVKEMAKLGLEAKVQEDAFARFTDFVGTHGDVLAKALERASGDVINTSDIMLAAVRGLREGFDPTQLVALMETARQQSKLTGQDVAAAFNDITQAIANQQPKLLKHFGVVLDVERLTKTYEATLADQTKELTSAGKAQLFYAAFMKETAASTKALTTEQTQAKEVVERLASQYKQLQEDIGKFLVDAGLNVLGWLESVKRDAVEAGVGLTKLGTIWGEAFKAGEGPLKTVADLLRVTLIPVLKGAAIVAGTLGVGFATMTEVIAGPLAFLGSILSDLANKQFPDIGKAAKAQVDAMKDAAGHTDKAFESLRKLTGAMPELVEPTNKAGKAVEDLGKNKLAGALTQTKLLTTELDSLNKAMRALADQAAEGVMTDFDKDVESIAKGVMEAAKATKLLSADQIQGLEKWARTMARIVVENKALRDLPKATLPITISVQDIEDVTNAWATYRAAVKLAAVDTDDLTKAEGAVAAAATLLQTIIDKNPLQALGPAAQEARDELRKLKNDLAIVAAPVPMTFDFGITGVEENTKALSAYQAALRAAASDTVATGDGVAALQAKMSAAAAETARMADKFGVFSAEAAKAKAEFLGFRDEFNAASLAESLRVIDVQAQAFGSTFETIPAKLEAVRAALNAMAREAQPNAEAMAALKTQFDQLNNLNTSLDLLKTTATQVGDALIDMAMTGKANFKDMADAIIKDILRIIIKLLILKAVEMLTSSFGGFGGGSGANSRAFASGGGGFAKGGIVKSRPGGRLIIAGEGGQDEAIIPKDRWGEMGGGGDVSINVEIINQTGSPVSSKTEQSTGPDGMKKLRIFLRGEMNAAVGDGALDSVLNGSFGMKRRGVSR